MKKILASLLCALIAASILIGCSGEVKTPNPDSGNNPAGGNTSASESVGAETSAADLVASHLSGLPQHNFDGIDFTFYVPGEAYTPYWQSKEIYAENENAEPINDAVYRRNKIIEELFNIVIKEKRAGAFESDIRKYVNSNDTGYDIMMPPLSFAAKLSRENLFEEFGNIQNVDVTMPWWDHMVKIDLSIKGKQYFTIGDISILDKEATRGIFFSKKLIGDYNLESPYGLVEKNEWTCDKFGEMARKVCKDLDGDGVINELDQFGIISEIGNSQNFINAFGGRIASLDKDGIPQMTVKEEKIIDYFTKINELFYDTNLTFTVASTISKTSKTYSNIWDITINMFSEDRALFMPIGMNNLNTFRSMKTDFGLLPNPKYDENQKEYYSPVYMGAPATVCFPINNPGNNDAGLIVEALCAESYITLKPAYYEICLKGKYVRDSESENMLDLIFKNRVYDIGVVYNFGNITGIFGTLVNKKSNDVVSAYTKIEKAAQHDLDALAKS